jgi:hypothetical protein
MAQTTPAESIYHIRLSSKGAHAQDIDGVVRCYLPSWIPRNIACTVTTYSAHLFFKQAVVQGASISLETNIGFLGCDFDTSSQHPKPSFSTLCTMNLSGVQIETEDHWRTNMSGNGAPMRCPGGLPSVIEVWATASFFDQDEPHTTQSFDEQGIEVLMMVKFD